MTPELEQFLAEWDGLFSDEFRAVSDALDLVMAVEREIDRFSERHPDRADLLFHAFRLMRPDGRLPRTEFVYLSHTRQLLQRVAEDGDTREATDVEVCLLCVEIAKAVPLNTTAMGLLVRNWNRAFDGIEFPGREAGVGLEHYEALKGSQIDDFERQARRKLYQPKRVIGEPECRGMHHGREVGCRFAS